MKIKPIQLIYLVVYFGLILDFYWSIPANYTYLRVLAGLSFLFPIIAALHAVKLKFPGLKFLNEIGALAFSGFAFIFFINMLALLMPQLPKALPPGVISYYEFENLAEVRSQTVEYLDESPFVKFKPLVEARSQGYRGDSTEFRYTWLTDEWGFKNKTGKTKDSCQVLFLGNSFTEGMGVSISKTLPSQFEEITGLTTYNLGVQGYAPTQMLGTYERYADKLGPQSVFLVYYSTIFERENNFRNLERAIKERKFTGGIGNISEQENRREIKAGRQSNRVISAILIFGYVQIREQRTGNAKDKVQVPDIEMKNPIFASYIPEMQTANNQHYSSLIEAIQQGQFAWQQTLEVINQLKEKCETANRQFTLVYIPRRAIVYGKVLLKDMRGQTYIDDVERKAFKQFCQKQGIDFLDPTEELIQYVQEKKDSIKSKALLPYLPIDRHMSPVGYKEVATFMADHLSLFIEKE